MPGKMRKIWFIAGGAAIVLVAILFMRTFRSTPASSVILRPGSATETVLATGRVVGEKTIPLSFLRPGRIAGELVVDGAGVKAGQSLMRQESEQEETALAQKRTARAIAKLNLEKLLTIDLKDLEQKIRQVRANAVYADDVFKRQSELYKERTIPFQQFEQSKRDKELTDATLEAALNQLRSLQGAEKALAELRISQAENDMRRAEIDVRDTILRAPFDGTVIEHLAHRGEFVAAGQKVITFIPESPQTYIEIQVDEANIGQLRLGQKARIASPAFPDRTFGAVVERLGGIVDTQKGTFSVRLAMETFEPGLLPESSVSVQVVLGEVKNILLLEQRFLVRDGRESFVYTPEAGRARRRAVTAREFGNGQFGIEAGLKEGDTVLLPQGLRDGAKVRPVPVKK